MKQDKPRKTKPRKPFFARYLEDQKLDEVTGGATTKFPSDSDETLTTLKFPSDKDEEPLSGFES